MKNEKKVIRSLYQYSLVARTVVSFHEAFEEELKLLFSTTNTFENIIDERMMEEMKSVGKNSISFTNTVQPVF